MQLIDDRRLGVRMGMSGRARIEDELQWKHEAPGLLAAYSALWPDVADGAPQSGAACRTGVGVGEDDPGQSSSQVQAASDELS